jgi:hypothetical protein
MSGLESRLQGSGDPHRPALVCLGALRFDSGVDHPGPSQRQLDPKERALVFKLRRLGFSPIRYRQLPFWAWGLTWNFIQHLLLWKFRLRMRTYGGVGTYHLAHVEGLCIRQCLQCRSCPQARGALATFGTYFDPQAIANAIPNPPIDHRTITPAQPLAVYIGLRAKL